jgi:hypothetical protein
MLAFDNQNSHALLTPNTWFGGSYAIMGSFRHGLFKTWSLSNMGLLMEVQWIFLSALCV